MGQLFIVDSVLTTSLVQPPFFGSQLDLLLMLHSSCLLIHKFLSEKESSSPLALAIWQSSF